MKFLISLLLILSLCGLSQAQDWLFEGSTGHDSVSVDSGGTYISKTIIFNAKPEGVATLFCAGDTSSGIPLGVTGTWQVYQGLTATNDSLFGVATAFDDSVLVKGDLDNGEYDDGTLVGRGTDLGAIPWQLGTGVKFTFTVHYTGWFLARLIYY